MRGKPINHSDSSQCMQILFYIREHGSITGMESVKNLGILNYKARINELREDGFPIVTTMETSVKQNGDKTRYARYSLNRRQNYGSVGQETMSSGSGGKTG